MELWNKRTPLPNLCRPSSNLLQDAEASLTELSFFPQNDDIKYWIHVINFTEDSKNILYSLFSLFSHFAYFTKFKIFPYFLSFTPLSLSPSFLYSLYIQNLLYYPSSESYFHIIFIYDNTYSNCQAKPKLLLNWTKFSFIINFA